MCWLALARISSLNGCCVDDGPNMKYKAISSRSQMCSAPNQPGRRRSNKRRCAGSENATATIVRPPAVGLLGWVTDARLDGCWCVCGFVLMDVCMCGLLAYLRNTCSNFYGINNIHFRLHKCVCTKMALQYFQNSRNVMRVTISSFVSSILEKQWHSSLCVMTSHHCTRKFHSLHEMRVNILVKTLQKHTFSSRTFLVDA